MGVKWFVEHLLFIEKDKTVGYTECEAPIFHRHTAMNGNSQDLDIGTIFHANPKELTRFLTTWNNMNAMKPLWIFDTISKWIGFIPYHFHDDKSVFWNDMNKLEDWD